MDLPLPSIEAKIFNNELNEKERKESKKEFWAIALSLSKSRKISVWEYKCFLWDYPQFVYHVHVTGKTKKQIYRNVK